MARIWIPIYEEDEGDDCDDEEEVENSAPLPSTWPISLQRFVDRSFSQCVTQEKVLVAFSENILFTKNWEANPDFPRVLLSLNQRRTEYHGNIHP